MTSVTYVWNKREWVCSVKQGTWKFQLSGVIYSIALQWTTVSIRLLNAANDWSESESNPSAPSSAHSNLRGLRWKKEKKVPNCVVPELLAPYTDPEYITYLHQHLWGQGSVFPEPAVLISKFLVKPPGFPETTVASPVALVTSVPIVSQYCSLSKATHYCSIPKKILTKLKLWTYTGDLGSFWIMVQHIWQVSG